MYPTSIYVKCISTRCPVTPDPTDLFRTFFSPLTIANPNPHFQYFIPTPFPMPHPPRKVNS